MSTGVERTLFCHSLCVTVALADCGDSGLTSLTGKGLEDFDGSSAGNFLYDWQVT